MKGTWVTPEPCPHSGSMSGVSSPVYFEFYSPKVVILVNTNTEAKAGNSLISTFSPFLLVSRSDIIAHCSGCSIGPHCCRWAVSAVPLSPLDLLILISGYESPKALFKKK